MYVGGGESVVSVRPDPTHADVADIRWHGPVRRSPHLRMILVLVDATLLFVGASVAHLVLTFMLVDESSLALSTATNAVVVGAGLGVMGAAGLYRRRICSVRAREVARLGVSVIVLVPVVVLLLSRQGLGPATAAAGVAGGVWFVGLVAARGMMREWIQARRAIGDFAAPVVVVAGSSDALQRIGEFVATNSVLGFEVRGMVGPAGEFAAEGPSWLGETSELVAHAAGVGASGAVLDGRSLTGEQLNDLTQRLTEAGLHVHLSTGLVGVDARRITASGLADETFLHVAPMSLSLRQMRIKRLMDVVIGSLALLLTAPVLIVSAIAIWLNDGGPILFRQQRLGHGGEPFTMYKLRTMVPDAEARRSEFEAHNQRDGPLFKMAGDPRVTPVGRILRALSIDELPQLFNAIEGTMSLVGPRPALASEVAQFDDTLLARMGVKPGLTGLWQVEARDVASFDLYRRYDLMYVRNWSIAGDLSLLGRTVAVLGVRTATSLVRLIRGDSHVGVID